MSSRTAVTGKVGELSFESDAQAGESSSRKRRRLDMKETSNESDVQTEDLNRRSFIFTSKGLKCEMSLRTSPDGRYFFYIGNCGSSVEVIDTLFKKKTHFNFNFSAATINGRRLIGGFEVIDYWAFDLENSLVIFDNPFYGWCVATGVLNREHSTVVIGQSTAISSGYSLFSKSRFIPKSYPANLKDGLILKVAEGWSIDYFDVKLDDQNQLQATRINSLSNVDVVAVNEDFAYSLDWKSTVDETQLKEPYFELSKRSLGTGELSSYPTMNSEAMGKLAFESGCRVGNKFFGYTRNYSTNKSQIISLNLDTLEWTKTEIELNGGVYQMASDGERTLIICMRESDWHESYYRFVFNKPDSLSTCIWRNLQSIVNSRPDVYDFIRSKLPTNFSSPRPIEHSVPLDTEL